MAADFPAASATSWQSLNHIVDVVQRFQNVKHTYIRRPRSDVIPTL